MTACGGAPPSQAPAWSDFPPDSALSPAPTATSPGILLDTIATSLVVPWALAFTPDGRVLVTERAGRIRVIENGRLRERPWATLAVVGDDPEWRPEAGLMGIAVAPDFATSRHVYVLATFWKADSAALRALPRRLWRRVAATVSPLATTLFENRIVRFTERDGQGGDPQVVVDHLPADYYHDGGALGFGPDGMLYATIGDVLRPALAQRPRVAAGKVLRVRPDGTEPPDNPFPGSPVWALGLRNSQALAWHPVTHDLFVTEHGPTGMSQEGGRAGFDEVNVVTRAGNYGWPRGVGRAESGAAQPIRVWATAVAPAGATFYTGPDPRWRGSLFVGGLQSLQLRRLVPVRDGDSWRIAGEESFLVGRLGRIRALAMGPDGYLYLTTSNRDGRGVPGPHDDLIVRVRPGP